MTEHELTIQRTRDVLRQLREQAAQVRADEDLIREKIESATRRLEQARAVLAAAPDELQAELRSCARRIESDLQLFAAMARFAASRRAMLDSMDERLRSHPGVEPT